MKAYMYTLKGKLNRVDLASLSELLEIKEKYQAGDYLTPYTIPSLQIFMEQVNIMIEARSLGL